MKFIKKNKFMVLVIVMFIFVVIVGFQVTKLIFPDVRSPQYGNRLDGIDKVKIKETKLDSLKSSLKELDYVTKVITKVSGKTVNIHITVSDITTIENAKKLSEKVLLYFNTPQLKYYDIQLFISKKDLKLNNFPIIGYRHRSSNDFTWSKDRGVTTNEDKK
ncbi:MAG: hypothetical protein RR359_04770 [Bacilli bacterium]